MEENHILRHDCLDHRYCDERCPVLIRKLLLAHALPEGFSNVIEPVVVIVVMFFADWKQALLYNGILICYDHSVLR